MRPCTTIRGLRFCYLSANSNHSIATAYVVTEPEIKPSQFRRELANSKPMAYWKNLANDSSSFPFLVGVTAYVTQWTDSIGSGIAFFV